MSKLKILIIDDHCLMIEGYKTTITTLNLNYDIEITSAYSCEEGYKIITNFNFVFDFIFLDINLPPYIEARINSGKDLAILAQKYFPISKIIILTAYTEAIILYDILKKINPSGFLVKSDFTSNDLIVAFKQILIGNKYYSLTVRDAIKKIGSKTSYLDNYNRQIILLLSKGIKTKNLPNYMPLSISAIDKRKIFIKNYFQIEKGSDEDIIYEAKKNGLV